MSKHKIIKIGIHSYLPNAVFVETIGEIYIFKFPEETVIDILRYLQKQNIDISDIDVFKLVEKRCELL